MTQSPNGICDADDGRSQAMVEALVEALTQDAQKIMENNDRGDRHSGFRYNTLSNCPPDDINLLKRLPKNFRKTPEKIHSS
jgi:hypothetical protein